MEVSKYAMADNFCAGSITPDQSPIYFPYKPDHSCFLLNFQIPHLKGRIMSVTKSVTGSIC